MVLDPVRLRRCRSERSRSRTRRRCSRQIAAGYRRLRAPEFATLSKEAIMPSPVCLISRPPYASSPRRTSASCARTSSSAALSPRRAVISVEPTMSGNMTARNPESTAGATAPGAARGSPMRPRNASTVARSTGMMRRWGFHHGPHDGPASAVAGSGAWTRQKAAPFCSSNQ